MLCGTMKARYVYLVLAIVFFSSCKDFFSSEEEKKVVARVGESYLNEEDIASLLKNSGTSSDSAILINNYINNWAKKQLLLSKAKINLPEEKLSEYDRLVNDYRADLYTRAYVEALVSQSQDTTINSAEINSFYSAKKENFKLKEKLVQLHFAVLPPQFLNKDEVVKRIKRFDEEDKEFLDSISVQFKKLHLNDSIWVSVARLMDEVPPMNFQNQQRHLKKSQYFELQDSLGVYLGKVTNVLNKDDIAPLQYVEPNIKQLILNKRRLDFIKKMETEILDEALQKKEFEIYE